MTSGSSDILYAQISVSVPVDVDFTYSVPPTMAPRASPGARVLMPFGRRTVRGVILSIGGQPPPPGIRCREIDEVIDPIPLLTPALLDLGRDLASYYMCGIGEMLDAMVPPPAGLPRPIERVVVPEGRPAVDSLPARARKLRELALAIGAHAEGLTRAQLKRLFPNADRHIRGLLQAGIAAIRLEQPPAPEVEAPPATGPFYPLTPEQLRCFESVASDLEAGRNATHLIHGITGSGKTEIYLHLIRLCRDGGRGAVFLLPEISLTVPMMRVLKERFGRDVAVLHSAMTCRERYSEWLAIARGQKLIVVGARSAVFAPLARPALFVIDEEAETSYKQEEKPCYHAREVARRRAARHAAVVVLGSATPSLESFHEGSRGIIGYHRLRNRVNGLPLPEVTLIDMRTEFTERKNRSVFSMALKTELATVLDSGGQALLFLNRRGHSTYVFCRACGEKLECGSCTVVLTYHMTTGRLRCHLCGFEAQPPRRCPKCQDPAIRYCGGGTQKVEEEFRANFPGVEASRMDSDTTSGRGSHQRIFEAYASGRTRVLIGTQMVAKGFDFPNLDLVGVMNADSGLHTSDFRSAERTFQLVTQVAGRVGRGSRPGKVLVQTYCPSHYSLVAAQRHDFDAFVDTELPQREALGYPPFARIIRVTAECDEEALAESALRALKDHAANLVLHRVRVMGPAPARVLKVADRFRYCLLVKVPLATEAGDAVRARLRSFQPPAKITLKIDVDPMA
ncbi:MAG: primosomal protein N' [Candidatus Riflebacteria bacterium]|nr:primosomal protein N' [Candidatus Riflebacteria bacterium]